MYVCTSLSVSVDGWVCGCVCVCVSLSVSLSLQLSNLKKSWKALLSQLSSVSQTSVPPSSCLCF
jgi:hypothetical protein